MSKIVGQFGGTRSTTVDPRYKANLMAVSKGVLESQNLKDLKFTRYKARTATYMLKGELITKKVGGGYKEGAQINAEAAPDNPPPHEVKSQDEFGIVADAPGLTKAVRANLPSTYKSNFYVVATSKIDGKIKAQIWYETESLSLIHI